MLHKERNYGIDALRIVAMFMVVILHVLGWGGILESVKEFSANCFLAWLIEISVFCAVNCYAIVSGYVGYGKRIKYSNLIYLLLCAVFYMVVISLLAKIFVPSIGIQEFWYLFLDIRHGGYWYVTAYLCAFFFFPHINFFVERYEKKKLYIIAGCMIVLFSVIPTAIRADLFYVAGGYSPLWLMVMYFVGALIKKYDTKSDDGKNKYLLFYVLMVIVTLLSEICIQFITKKFFGRVFLSKWLVSYVSPTIVFSAIFLVKYFSKIKINNLARKMVSFMSPLTFGVYLIHTQYFIWGYLENRFAHFANKNPLDFVLSILLTSGAIYILCILIDSVRQYLFTIARVKAFSEKTERKLLKLTDRIMNRMIE